MKSKAHAIYLLSIACVLALPAGAVEFKRELTREEREVDRQLTYVRATEAALVGKTFWFEPNEEALKRVKFLESIPNSEPSHRMPTFRPTARVKFTVPKIHAVPKDVGHYYYVEVLFDGGKSGYLSTHEGQDPLRQYTLHENFSFPYEIFEEDPEVVRAKARRTAAAEAKAEKARAARGGVRVGMTKDQVLKSNWGRPTDINKTTTARGTREQWVYDGGYLYFDNGILTTIQN